MKILQVRNLKKYFYFTRGIFFKKKLGEIKAVDGVSFEIEKGETFGLVGESGCGKTTLGRIIARIYKQDEGEIIFEGENITENFNRKISKKIQIIFQNPYASLNPRMTVGEIIEEPLKVHNIGTKKERIERVNFLLGEVGLSEEYFSMYPHQLSGGQRQRVGIARSLSINPSFIVCDEPISSLDVSIQAQIVNMLKELQEKFNLTYLFIAHDISMVKHMSDKIAVMYLGKIVEVARKQEFYKNPLHPYTRALISAIPHPYPEKKIKLFLEREIFLEDIFLKGCKFFPRCNLKNEKCRDIEPDLKEVLPDHYIACHIF